MGKPLREIPGARSAVAGLSCGALCFILLVANHIDEAAHGGAHVTGHEIFFEFLISFIIGGLLAIIFRCFHKLHIRMQKPFRLR
ncbi:MAG: hypothetical protein MJY77_07730 [Bacteroidaceae bacterium]|nr:hypothetical protein [Bacteroidaceae bacterium]